MERVHVKMSQILDEVSIELNKAADSVDDISKGVFEKNDLLKRLEDIDLCRKKLALLDANLDDCYSVLMGLVNYKTKDDKDAQRQTE